MYSFYGSKPIRGRDYGGAWCDGSYIYTDDHLNPENTYHRESCKAVIKLVISRLPLHACTRDVREQQTADRRTTSTETAPSPGGSAAQQEIASTSTTPDTVSRRRHPEPPLLSGHRTRSHRSAHTPVSHRPYVEGTDSASGDRGCVLPLPRPGGVVSVKVGRSAARSALHLPSRVHERFKAN